MIIEKILKFIDEDNFEGIENVMAEKYGKEIYDNPLIITTFMIEELKYYNGEDKDKIKKYISNSCYFNKALIQLSQSKIKINR